jgi:CDP-diacylglycerol--glycerol-3-phosphate 3-phosphatidyltransferase
MKTASSRCPLPDGYESKKDWGRTMASVYDLKPGFQALVRPICKGLANRGVTANLITIAATILSVVAGVWIAFDPLSSLPYLLLPLVLFVRMALNAMDGILAREFNMQSPLGAILNEMGDVVSDVVLYLPFGFHPSVPWWTIIAIVVLGIIVEMVGVVSVQIGASRRYDGPFGKSDRAIAFGLLGLLLGFGVVGDQWVFWYLLTALGLSVVTIVNRARNSLDELGVAE